MNNDSTNPCMLARSLKPTRSCCPIYQVWRIPFFWVFHLCTVLLGNMVDFMFVSVCFLFNLSGNHWTTSIGIFPWANNNKTVSCCILAAVLLVSFLVLPVSRLGQIHVDDQWCGRLSIGWPCFHITWLVTILSQSSPRVVQPPDAFPLTWAHSSWLDSFVSIIYCSCI